MGTDMAEDVETPTCCHDMKVHRQMCTELDKLYTRVSKVVPDIEASRIWCSSGIEALCLLSSARDKVVSLLQQCRESSKLYLALTGNAVLSRCNKSRNLLVQSLSQIQNMVPEVLAAEIFSVITDLKGARFSLDPSEEAAGKLVRELLHLYESAPGAAQATASRAIQAALMLHITSQKDVLIEKRSIKKLLREVGEGDSSKRKILLFFLDLLDKYGKLIVEEHKKLCSMQLKNHLTYSLFSERFAEVESCVKYEPHRSHIGPFSQPAVPDEFRCPLSSEVMYDPVVIASGQTFERMSIQKWFDEDNDTCPKTKAKLAHLMVTPNASLKDLISKWCSSHGITVPDLNVQAMNHSLETSLDSIASLTSSLNDLSLSMDYSSLNATLANTNGLGKTMRTAGDDSRTFHSGAHESEIEGICKLDSLPWESQCSLVENIASLLNYDDLDWELIRYQDISPPLMRFLKHAHELNDVKAQRNGCLLLLILIKKCSKLIAYIDGDAYDLLASFINSEVVKEALLIWEALSCNEHSRSQIGASGALVHVLRMLDSQTSEFHELVLNIIYNSSKDSEVCSLLVSSAVIPKLVPFLEDAYLAKYSVCILKNVSHKEGARVSIAETYGCIASLAKVLKSDSCEDQEHAMAVLLSLCSQRIQYCQLVMNEDVILDLIAICVNGNSKGKTMAMELLRLLEDESNGSAECSESDLGAPVASQTISKERKSSSKAPRIFGKLLVYLKASSLTARSKGSISDQ